MTVEEHDQVELVPNLEHDQTHFASLVGLHDHTAVKVQLASCIDIHSLIYRRVWAGVLWGAALAAGNVQGVQQLLRQSGAAGPHRSGV